MKKWDILSQEQNIHSHEEIVAILLKNRGITTDEEKEAFLNPRLDTITIDSVGIDRVHLTRTLDRLKTALDHKEQIIVFGDYDVDGITGTAILWETLIELGFNVMPYIPHRVEEGYGLSEKGIDNVLLEYPETKLIMTVDNGIVAGKAVAHAKEKGIEVIITDHHLPDDDHEQPDALAIVHTTKLCGAGVAWLLTKEIQKVFGKIQEKEEDTHLELAALATVADLVPLTGANRAIVYHGIKKLTKTNRFGLLELYTVAAINTEKFGVYEIGHVIGPRLNAAGRLESAMDSLRLLCTRDQKRAQLLAMQIDSTNKERQRIMFDSVAHASDAVREKIVDKKIIIIAHEEYEEGVIGLIAGRLVEEYYKPAIVISKGEKKSKGSVRSVNGFNIIEFLRSQPELFINVGGHPMAAGFTIETEKLEEFQHTLEKLAETTVTEEMLKRRIKVDLELSFNDISPELYYEVQKLSPFGMQNPEPVFISKDVLVREKRLLGKEGKHLRLILQGGDTGKVIEAIAFGMADRAHEIQEDETMDIAYTIDENEWRGTKKLQIKLKDFRK